MGPRAPEAECPSDLDALAATALGQYDTIIIDIEGACNLRCVYCYQSDRNFVPHKGMGEAVVDAAISLAKSYGRGAINVTSQGEFTHAKTWMRTAAKLLASGISVHCTSNLARPLTAPEIETLSKFFFICLSLDTADRETLRAVRRAADIRAIAHNVLRIRAAAAAEGRNPPHLVVNCVLSSANARQIPDLVAYCFALGASGVHLAPLHAYGDFGFDKDQLGDAAVSDPVETWDSGRLGELYADFVKTIEIARHAGKAFAIAPGLAQRFEARLKGADNSAKDVPPGQTRLCLQPWDRAVVNHDGSITPCCYGADPVGNIATDGIEAVMGGEKLVALKRALLTGENLPAACRGCVGEAIGAPEIQQARVRHYLAQRRPT